MSGPFASDFLLIFRLRSGLTPALRRRGLNPLFVMIRQGSLAVSWDPLLNGSPRPSGSGRGVIELDAHALNSWALKGAVE